MHINFLSDYVLFHCMDVPKCVNILSMYLLLGFNFVHYYRWHHVEHPCMSLCSLSDHLLRMDL